MIADFNRKENSKFFNENLLFKVIGVLLLLGVIALTISGFRIYQKRQKLTSQINTLKERIESLKKSSQTLEEEIANSDNIDYLEKLAYEQLNQTRPGETEYMFIKSSAKTETPAKTENFWDKFTGWLSGSWLWIKSKF